MLDIYYNEDHIQDIPDTPDEDKYLASIDMAQHKSMANLFQKCTEKGIDFPYFEDALLRFKEVDNMWNIFKENSHLLEKNQASQESYKLFLEVLLVAIQKKAGLVTYCD